MDANKKYLLSFYKESIECRDFAKIVLAEKKEVVANKNKKGKFALGSN